MGILPARCLASSFNKMFLKPDDGQVCIVHYSIWRTNEQSICQDSTVTPGRCGCWESIAYLAQHNPRLQIKKSEH